MKIYLTTLSFILINLYCYGQQPGTMVVANSGIYVRDSSSLNSDKTCSIPFGEMIEILNEPRVKDVVNGMKGNWWKIKYKSCVGYVFDAYLANIMKQDKNFPDNYPQYFNLDAICGEEQYFNSDFFWYGIFELDSKFKISLVDVEFSITKENWSDEMYDEYLKINVVDEPKPMFLIGLPDSITNYEIDKSAFNNGPLFPGQYHQIGYTKSGNSYYIASYGATEELDDNNHFILPYTNLQNYKIKMVERSSNRVESQDLWKDIQQPIRESMPSIKFIGDLNNDDVPDIIITHSPDYRIAETYIFMSGYEKDKFLTLVGINHWGTCY